MANVAAVHGALWAALPKHRWPRARKRRVTGAAAAAWLRTHLQGAGLPASAGDAVCCGQQLLDAGLMRGRAGSSGFVDSRAVVYEVAVPAQRTNVGSRVRRPAAVVPAELAAIHQRYMDVAVLIALTVRRG